MCPSLHLQMKRHCNSVKLNNTANANSTELMKCGVHVLTMSKANVNVWHSPISSSFWEDFTLKYIFTVNMNAKECLNNCCHHVNLSSYRLSPVPPQVRVVPLVPGVSLMLRSVWEHRVVPKATKQRHTWVCYLAAFTHGVAVFCIIFSPSPFALVRVRLIIFNRQVVLFRCSSNLLGALRIGTQHRALWGTRGWNTSIYYLKYLAWLHQSIKEMCFVFFHSEPTITCSEMTVASKLALAPQG